MLRLLSALSREAARRSLFLAAGALAPLRMDFREWLFGGSVGAAFTDNSAALFRHVRDVHPEVRATFVINRDSPHLAHARSVGAVAWRDALDTHVRAFNAAVHVISHGVHDVPGCSSRMVRRPVKVRLGHGLTMLKKTKASGLRRLSDIDRIFDLVPVASELEAENKRRWGFSEEKLVVTGLPRFDTLLRKHRKMAGGIRGPLLYMPTWRDWIPATRSGLRRSSFLGEVMAFLGSRMLLDALAAHDTHIEVAVHPLMHEHIGALAEALSGDRVRVLARDIDVQDALVQASALVTDYSSVAWDALYIDKPVLFFPFDVDAYETHRGGYIDLRRDLPGPAAFDAHGAAAMVTHALDQGFELAEKAREWQERVFTFRDDGNAARVTKAIFARLPAEASA